MLFQETIYILALLNETLMLLPTPWGYLPRQHNSKMNDFFYAIHSKSQKPENGKLKIIGFYYPDSKLTIEEQEAHVAVLSAAHELLEALQRLLNVDPKAVDVSEKINAEHNAIRVIKKATKKSIYE